MSDASQATAYHGYYVMLAGLMMVTLAGVGCLEWIRRQRTTEDADG